MTLTQGTCQECSIQAQIHVATGLCENCYIGLIRGY